MQKWWNLSKLVTNNLVSFGNFFSYIILSPLFLLRKKYLQIMLFGRNGQVPSAWGIMIKAWGRVLLGGMSKIEQMTYKCICSSLNTINLKLFRNHSGIYRFRKKFKKDSGEIKPLRVYRNLMIGDRQCVCLLFCWSWSNAWDNFQKREGAESGGIDFETVDIDTSVHWY